MTRLMITMYLIARAPNRYKYCLIIYLVLPK